MFLQLGGGFVMSDDSHGIEHIATNYQRLLTFIQKAGIQEIYFADKLGECKDSRFPDSGFSTVKVVELARSKFWANLQS